MGASKTNNRQCWFQDFFEKSSSSFIDGIILYSSWRLCTILTAFPGKSDSTPVIFVGFLKRAEVSGRNSFCQLLQLRRQFSSMSLFCAKANTIEVYNCESKQWAQGAPSVNLASLPAIFDASKAKNRLLDFGQLVFIKWRVEHKYSSVIETFISLVFSIKPKANWLSATTSFCHLSQRALSQG